VEVLNLILDLIAKACVVIVVAYIVSRTRYFIDILDKQFTAKNQIILILIFGILSIYGTYSGIKIPSGAIVNIRDLGAMVAGLVGGPVVGLGAGLIGGVHRYFLGGFTAIPCALATVIAGLAAGIIFQLRKGKLISIWGAAVFAILMESLHMGLVLLIARPYSQALQTVKLISLPMILANAVGVAIFVWIVSTLIKERKI